MSDDDLDQPDAEGYELVMPFVTVASKGGPHDDISFSAGWTCGMWDARLELAGIAAATVVEAPFGVPTACLPQLDLIAMKHDFRMLNLSEHIREDGGLIFEGWTPVRFEVNR